jgi:hypothetical protein
MQTRKPAMFFLPLVKAEKEDNGQRRCIFIAVSFDDVPDD